jgi:PAS domain S-box-containing protein
MPEPEILERQAMLAAIIDSSEDAIISKDLSSRITSWNPSAERMFGYSANEMIGQLIHILIPDDRKYEEEQIIASLKRGERVEHFETIRVTKGGKKLHISLTISPIKDANGKIIGASKIARDITQQKLIEERLRILNELSKSINTKLDVDVILQLVTDACTKAVGAGFGAFFYNKIDEKGASYMLYALSGADRSHFDKFGMPRNTMVFNSTFQGIEIVRSDNILKDYRYGHNAPHHGMPKGHLPVVSYLAVPVKSQNGLVIGGLFFGHPEEAIFTEEHESLAVAIASQAAIALDNAKLLQEVNLLNKRKDEFIGFASHELKTPLTTLKGYMEIALAGGIQADQLVPKAKKQIERLESIISDLLDISRIQAGKLDIVFKKTSLFSLIRDSIDLVDSNDHNLEIKYPAEDIFICIDGNKISQVLVNLLSNAIKYSEKNTSIYIRAEVLGDMVQIQVEDEGPGIKEDDLKKIFDQYFRAAGTQNETKGIGLGLFISKVLIETHGGHIWAESTPGKGSVFSIQIPIDRSDVLK